MFTNWYKLFYQLLFFYKTYNLIIFINIFLYFILYFSLYANFLYLIIDFNMMIWFRFNIYFEY